MQSMFDHFVQHSNAAAGWRAVDAKRTWNGACYGVTRSLQEKPSLARHSGTFAEGARRSGEQTATSSAVCGGSRWALDNAHRTLRLVGHRFRSKVAAPNGFHRCRVVFSAMNCESEPTPLPGDARAGCFRAENTLRSSARMCAGRPRWTRKVWSSQALC